MKQNQLSEIVLQNRDYNFRSDKETYDFLTLRLSGEDTSLERFRGFQIAWEFLQYLENLGITYSWCIKHPKPSSCTDSIQYYARFHDYLGEPENYVVCKHLFLQERKQPERKYFVLTAQEKVLDFKQLQEQLGSKKLEFVKDTEIRQIFHTYPGNLSIFHAIYDCDEEVHFLLDQELFQKSDFSLLAFHPLYNELSLFMRPQQTLQFLEEIAHSYQLISLPERKMEGCAPKQYVKKTTSEKL